MSNHLGRRLFVRLAQGPPACQNAPVHTTTLENPVADLLQDLADRIKRREPFESFYLPYPLLTNDGREVLVRVYGCK